MTPSQAARSTPARAGVRGRRRPPREPAAELPIARVAIDVSLAHLDRPFDYVVSERDASSALPGVRVRVRFSGRLVDGFVLERCAASDHPGRLSMIERVTSSEVVLTAPIARLCRTIADRYAGTMADVLRLAIPPRHGRAEQRAGTDPDSAPDDPAIPEHPDPSGVPDDPVPDDAAAAGLGEAWARYPAASPFADAVRQGRAARAVWQALPGEDWPARLAELAAAVHRAGRGCLLVVPDARDLARLDAALSEMLPPRAHTTLAADLGPAERYRRFLEVSRGRVRVVAGTRAASFAPVRDLALVAMFDDGDDLYAEPRAPYPHTREILMTRSVHERAAMLLGGMSRTAEGHLLVESGWAHSITAERPVVRRYMPRIEAAGDEYAIGADSAAARARLTPAAFAAARRALDADTPVLVQVPRRGYLPGLACAECRRPARCRRCAGPLAIPGGGGSPTCRWCGVSAPAYACPGCGSHRIRATVTGARRTAEEIGRAFPGTLLRTSAAGGVVDVVAAGPAIVVATPGAEPVADGGYGAVLLLDGGLLLARADLRAAEEALRRWMAAAALARPAADGGRVVVGASASLPTVQALIRWDPVGHAEGELAARRELGFPPVTAMASVRGSESAVAEAVAAAALPPSAEILGPTTVDSPRTGHDQDGEPAAEVVQALIRVAAPDRRALARALQVLAAARSTRKGAPPVRIDVDPRELG